MKLLLVIALTITVSSSSPEVFKFDSPTMSTASPKSQSILTNKNKFSFDPRNFDNNSKEIELPLSFTGSESLIKSFDSPLKDQDLLIKIELQIHGVSDVNLCSVGLKIGGDLVNTFSGEDYFTFDGSKCSIENAFHYKASGGNELIIKFEDFSSYPDGSVGLIEGMLSIFKLSDALNENANNHGQGDYNDDLFPSKARYLTTSSGSTSESSSPLTTGQVIGIVIGFFFFFIVLTIVIKLKQRRDKIEKSQQPNNEKPSADDIQTVSLDQSNYPNDSTTFNNSSFDKKNMLNGSFHDQKFAESVKTSQKMTSMKQTEIPPNNQEGGHRGGIPRVRRGNPNAVVPLNQKPVPQFSVFSQHDEEHIDHILSPQNNRNKQNASLSPQRHQEVSEQQPMSQNSGYYKKSTIVQHEEQPYSKQSSPPQNQREIHDQAHMFLNPRLQRNQNLSSHENQPQSNLNPLPQHHQEVHHQAQMFLNPRLQRNQPVVSQENSQANQVQNISPQRQRVNGGYGAYGNMTSGGYGGYSSNKGQDPFSARNNPGNNSWQYPGGVQ